ncbi:MAG: nucleotidyl transferase AbiEii/AbiGii toxin family protein [Chloroflexota bacterium]
MSRLEAAFRRLLGRLVAHGAQIALVGGLAVSARTEPRFTRDADVCVAVEDDAQAEALIRSLQQEDFAVEALVEQEVTGRIASVRLVAARPDEAGIVLDLLFASSGIEAEVVAGVEVMELFEGLTVPIATVPALIALKVLARDDIRRPQDRVDLVALLAIASSADLAEARRLLVLIEMRGYGRGRKLLADLEALQDETRDR